MWDSSYSEVVLGSVIFTVDYSEKILKWFCIFQTGSGVKLITLS